MLLKHYKKHFFNSLKDIQDEQEIESFFFILIEYLHHLTRVEVALQPNFVLSDTEIEKWNSILVQLQQDKPIQYITGEAWFYGLRFEVNENTLIPRPETEELVAWILNSPITQGPSPITILEIGTGTGCIPIALKANLSQANVSAIDVSEKALEVAKRNAESNKVEINFILANILDVEDLLILSSPITHHRLPYNIIVSNPPYVRNIEKLEIKKNVLDYEPHLALFVEDTDALLFYRKIAQLALKSLLPNGLLFFEINQYLGKETVELLQNLGFKNCELKKDIYGNDRMIQCSV
jgi:release factor glutamine methyltransferase